MKCCMHLWNTLRLLHAKFQLIWLARFSVSRNLFSGPRTAHHISPQLLRGAFIESSARGPFSILLPRNNIIIIIIVGRFGIKSIGKLGLFWFSF